MKTEAERARERELYDQRRDAIAAKRAAKRAAMTPEEKEAIRVRGRELYARDREKVRARARELAAQRAAARAELKANPPLEPDPSIPDHYKIPTYYITSEGGISVLDGRIRNALVRLLSAAHHVQNLSNMRFGIEAIRTALYVEDHVRQHYAKKYNLVKWDRYEY